MIYVKWARPPQSTTLSPQTIAAAVWEEQTSSHTAAGSFGAFVQKLLTFAKFLSFN